MKTYICLILLLSSITVFSKESQAPVKDCDGGTSKCSPCVDQYRDCFKPCNDRFDAYFQEGIHSASESGRILFCYERAFLVLGRAGEAYDSTSRLVSSKTAVGTNFESTQTYEYESKQPLMCPGKIRNALANHTRIHEEHMRCMDEAHITE